MSRRAAMQHCGGFTLVVVAALFVAFSVIAAMVIENNTNMRQVTMNDAAKEKLTLLGNAILKYHAEHTDAAGNHIYPCPAQLDQLPSDVDASGHSAFGEQANDGGSPRHANCATTLPGSGINTLTGSTELIRGMVPVQELGDAIAIDDAFDPWGDRIIYIVNRRLTYGGSAVGAVTERPTIRVLSTSDANNYLTGTNVAKPDFILISYGRDKVGGYLKSTTAVQIPCTGAAIRFDNCDNDVNFTQAAFFGNVNGDVDRYFDDIISYYRQ